MPAVSPQNTNYAVSNGVVTDLLTGLEWEQVASPTQVTQALAAATCATLSLQGSGWRLPTLIELESLVDYTVANPSINTTVFPGTAGQYYWTSTRRFGATATFWIVYFFWGSSGVLSTASPTTTAQVRCVRSAATALSRGAGAPPGRYVVGTDTVFDTKTLLTWQRAISPMMLSAADAATTCQGQTLGGLSGWRLPTIKELQTLIDVRASNPAIDTTAFPSVATDNLLSSTPNVSNAARPWIVSLSSGRTVEGNTAGMFLFRCVR
ncbi:MAG: DUF1566 domain-containing protein [Myxococcota bacterium]